MNASTMKNIIPAASFKQIDIAFVTPINAISRFVQCIWIVDRPKGSPSILNEKFYPDAGASLTFYIDQTSCEAKLFYHTEVCAMPWKLSGRQISIRFKPGALKRLFGFKLDDSKNLQIEFAEVLAKELESYLSLQEYLVGETIDNQCSAIQNWLAHIIENSDTRLQKWERMLYQSIDLLVPSQSLANQYGVSRRTIERQFSANFGFSPNKLYQFAQIRRARTMLGIGTSQLSEIALACGYFDQAHFTHAFRTFALETPHQYRTRKLSQIYN